MSLLLKNLVAADETGDWDRHFMKGNFVVKTKPGIFHGIAPDIKLEQTIQ